MSQRKDSHLEGNEIHLNGTVSQMDVSDGMTVPEEETVELQPAESGVQTLYELPEQRKRNRKVFRMSDGTQQAVFYAADVHVYNPDNEHFEEIDNTLQEEEDHSHYRNGRNGFAVHFNREAENEELFSIEQDKHSVTVRAARTVPQKKSGLVPHLGNHTADLKGVERHDALVFEEYMPSADLEYTVTGTGVKENIVVKEKKDDYRCDFDLLCCDVIPEYDGEEKTIRYLDTQTGEEVFCTPAPFMTDAAGACSGAVEYELRPVVDGRYCLSVVADSEWMNAEERVFPVTIDPQITVTGSSSMSTYSWTNNTMSNGNIHTVGLTKSGTTVCANRMYMKLNKPDLPRNPRIKKAELTLQTSEIAVSGASGLLVGLYEVERNITLENGNPTINPTLIDYRKVTAENNTYTFDVTGMVDKMMAGEAEKAQLVLKAVDETGTESNYVKLYGAGSGYAPQLMVTYEASYAVNTSYRAHTHDLGCFGQGSIDLQCGNLMFESEIFSWGGNLAPVTLKLLYNSALRDYAYTANSDIGLYTADFSAMKLGTGWKLNLQQSMVARNNGFVYVNENGEQIFFEACTDAACENGCCLYHAEGDNDMTYNCATRSLTMGSDIYQFDTAGRLVSIAYDNNNDNKNNENKKTITVQYDAGRVSAVTDGAGRVFAFTYNPAGQLVSITAPDGNQVRYTYLGDRLAGIQYPENRQVNIDWEEDALGREIITVEIDGYRVFYTLVRDRVTKVQECACAAGAEEVGVTTTYAYSAAANRTAVTVTQPVDVDCGDACAHAVTTTYSFDDDGDVISQYTTTDLIGSVAVSGNESGIHPFMGENGMSIIANADNLLLDSSFHCAMDSNTVWQPSANTGDSVHRSRYGYEPYTKYGHRLLWMESTADCVAKGVYQETITLPAGSYTFSTYLRVVKAFTGVTNAGAYLRVTAGEDILAESERLSDRESDFTRLAASFELDEATAVQVHILMDGEGIVFVDAAQLERNPYPNPFNLVENGNFERGFKGWTASSDTHIDENEKFNMNRSLRCEGELQEGCCAFQDVQVKQHTSTRETFTLSGWAKGPGLPDAERNGCEDPKFELRAEIWYADGEIEPYRAEFKAGVDAWQYKSETFSKKQFKPVDFIRVFCDYSYNTGEAYFDNIQLLRDYIETDLEEKDFVTTSENTEEQNEDAATPEGEADEIPGFTESFDAFDNPLTETTFTDGEFGTLYRSFGYSGESAVGAGDEGNDLVAETDARGYVTRYEVDPVTSRNTRVIDRCGHSTAYEYDEAGRTTKVTSVIYETETEENKNPTVSYAYDAFNNLTEIARGDGMKYALTYNRFHNLESIGVDGKNEKLIQYAYKNGNGRLKQMTYANGHTMKATYNGLGQLFVEKWYNESNELVAHYKYTYDGQGNLVRSIDFICQKEYTYTYDDGKIIRASGYVITLNDEENVTGKTLVHTIRYTYDKDSNLTRKKITVGDSEQTYQYTYPEDGQPVVTVTNGDVTYTSQSKNDHLGRKEFDELQIGSSFVSRQFHYHAGEVTEEHKSAGKLKSSPTTNLISEIVLSDGRTLSYEYDPEERITSVTETYKVGAETVTNTTSYTYDALGQLLTETANGVVVNSMEYDNYGNITKKNNTEYVYGEYYPDDDFTKEPVKLPWKDLLTYYNGERIDYDAQGNPTNYLGHTLEWEKGRQLKSFKKKGTSEAEGTISYTYTYNANGIRTSKTVGGVKHEYLLDGTKILRETWGSNTLVPLYDNEDSVCGIVYNNTPYYFQKNLQGDVIALVTEVTIGENDQEKKEQQVVARYSYDAWGVCTIVTDTSGADIATINPYRYRGYYYDVEIGLYYVSSRYYDPEIGRFLNADDFSKLSANGVVFDYNTFSYCKNNSVCNKDEYGYFGTPVQWLFAAIGAVAGWFLGDYIAKKLGYYSGWKYWAIRVGVVVGGAVIGWFAAKLLTKILQSFLNANKAIYNKLPRLAKKFLGLKCFVAGTLVSTANGEVKIEEISVGDYVLTYNFDTGNTEYNKVLQVFKNTTDILTCVCFDDEEIVSTPSHRYYVAEKGWIKAKDLQPGDKLILYDNSTKAVKSVYTKRSSIAVPVYNLNVENQHNYFVSKYQVLVHNLGCEDVATNTLKKISKAQIKKLGGEKVTREIKKQFGKSLSNLYVDAKGNVYVSVNGSKIAQWVGDLATLAEMYR